MNTRPSVIERAFQLAKSGRCASVSEIRSQLENEAYESAGAVRGSTLISRLDGMIKTAKTSKAAQPSAD